MVGFEGRLAIKQHEDTQLFVVGYEKGNGFAPLFMDPSGKLQTSGIPLAYKLYSKAKAAMDHIDSAVAAMRSEPTGGKNEGN